MNYEPVSVDVWTRQSERELKFWRHWLEHHATEHVSAPPLSDYLEPFVNGSAVIADLGAGACCLIGKRDGIEVSASDALANEYWQMWVDLGLVPEIQVARQDMGRLEYDDGSFDIVHCANALDHSADPRAAVLEMARVCRPGGVVYLVHIRDQARCAHYGGLHQWNVARDGTIWRRVAAGPDEPGRWSEERNGFVLTDCLPSACTRVGHRGTRIMTQWEKPHV
jgi:SAM-dependent methyltransferase